ncbi:hypothetical protein QUF76_02505 [Desulfobacterales bacterium HSG16]|nr:hypothetical protein [Desulfobacterales bacterium HSG16]
MTEQKVSISEMNSRAIARSRYFGLMYRRYKHIRLIEMTDEHEDPINLRRIFVPMRVDKQDIDEEKMAGPDEVSKEKLPGAALWDFLIENPFVSLSGRPGSGKSTLVQAIILELCGDHVSSFRKAMAKGRGMAPIPLILRNIPNLEKCDNLDELLEIWWEECQFQATADRLPLDLPRLKDSFDHKKEAYPVLMLFDGIDEVGGPDNRKKIYEMAEEAERRGHRVLLTGRPGGFTELSCKPSYLLPFAWEQINSFIRDWYRLRKDWERKQKDGINRFLEALQDLRRSYLLTLSRRPIFLTLMALVHCSRNEMPHGRAALYKAIVDLYLIRQERSRRLKETKEGKIMPHWPDQEKRMVLGYLAWLSQKKGSEEKNSDKQKRQVVWKKEKLLEAIKVQLSGRKYGRFTVLKNESCEDILNYFMHPAGLLIEPEPEKIQFAHLSFQEYLCADFLYGRGRVKGLKTYLKTELFSRIGQPGWDEVGMLLLAIHAEETQNEGHFEMLTWLDLSNGHQAGLLVKALKGRELPFTDEEREAWLPVAVGCFLTHPDRGFGEQLSQWPENLRQSGLNLIKELFDDYDHESLWKVLEDRLDDCIPPGIEELESYPYFKSLKDRWMPPPNDSTWSGGFGEEEARAYSLLSIVIDTEWASDNNDSYSYVLPFDSPLTNSIAGWFEERMNPKYSSDSQASSSLWYRENDDDSLVPVITNAGNILDAIVPDKGELWKKAVGRIAPDIIVLQGELYNDDYHNYCSQPSVLLSLFPRQNLCRRTSLGTAFYQAIVFFETISLGKHFFLFSKKRSRLLSRSQSQSRVWSRSWSWSRLRSWLLLHSRSRLRSRLRSQSQSQSRLRSRSQSQSQSLSIPESIKTKMSIVENYINKHNPYKEVLLSFYQALERYFYHYAGQDWFAEQSESPEMVKRRGHRIGEPLPKHLNLFDENGIPLEEQKRENLLKLKNWLDNDNEILKFFFPKGLPAQDRKMLLSDLALLKTQAWSPQAAVRAILADWLEDEPVRTCSMKNSEAMLEKACDDLIKKLNIKPEAKTKTGR